ncbi:MAG: ribonuclease III [Atopobiaceae bacterium]|nr:ribonuclease III [Atopobiaceae bacterium]MBR3316064.1 ribonuclease III [Atopobiaceae bacterium]
MKLYARVHEIERICDHEFEDKELVVSAITHSSAAEGLPVTASYERLEFLGDSVLGTLVARSLFAQFPRMDEGGLTRIKTALIAGKTLAKVADELGIAPLIRFGISELGTGTRGMRKALEDVYEALVGALYLDGGVDAAAAFVERTLMPLMDPSLAKHPLSAKSRLQEVAQRDYHCGPEYKIVSQEGPAHTPTFTAVAMVEGRRVGRGKGSSKKDAEGSAALEALKNMGYLLDEAEEASGE